MTTTTDAKPVVPPAPPAKPRPVRRGLSFSLPQVVLVMALVAVLWIIIDFSSRIQAEQRISAEANQLRAEVTAMAATQQAQATELAFVQSDAYVIQWAHSEGRLVQPGEVLVVPVPASSAEPTPVPQAAPPSAPVNNLQIWWDLFFARTS